MIDWWLILSLPCAVALAFVGDAIVETTSVEPLMTFRYGRTSEGVLRGWLEREPTAAWGITQPLGTATFYESATTRGWPLSTVAIKGPTTLKQTAFDGSCEIRQAPLLRADPFNNAMLAALASERLTTVADRWQYGTLTRTHALGVFIAQSGIYWIALFAFGAACIQTIRGSIAVARHTIRRRTIKRLAKGFCPRCHYNLAGATFPEYCPECGLKIWG